MITPESENNWWLLTVSDSIISPVEIIESLGSDTAIGFDV